LPGSADQAFAFAARRQRFGFISKAATMVRQSFFKRGFLLCAAPFHDATLLTFAPPINLKNRLWLLSATGHRAIAKIN
jgi:hypothetical protein